jgi:hypothetical protein
MTSISCPAAVPCASPDAAAYSIPRPEDEGHGRCRLRLSLWSLTAVPSSTGTGEFPKPLPEAGMLCGTPGVGLAILATFRNIAPGLLGPSLRSRRWQPSEATITAEFPGYGSLGATVSEESESRRAAPGRQ